MNFKIVDFCQFYVQFMKLNVVLQQQNFTYTPLFLTFKKCEMKKDCSTCDMFLCDDDSMY